MSIIVWDGKTLAADTMACNGNLRRYCTKVWRKGDMLIGGAGTATGIQAMLNWVDRGMDAESFPKDMTEDSVLWIVNKNGNMAKFENTPYPLTYHDKRWADGSGRDFAYGAMEMGADAATAVKVAMKHDAYCGGKVETVSFNDKG